MNNTAKHRYGIMYVFANKRTIKTFECNPFIQLALFEFVINYKK